MARIRLSGGIVLAGDQRVWLADDPEHEVDGTRPFPGAPVVVGPSDAGRTQVARARREAGRLLAGGGPLVAAAGVEVGDGFRTARLDGGGEARRDAVLAALELLGPEGMDRLGSRDSVLVALFGARATKRVGAAALATLAGGSRSALRLAVAASDVLGPEQLEHVLRLEAPAGVDPVPHRTTGLLSEQLAALLEPYPAPRRLALVRSLWGDVVAWQTSNVARGRGRRRRYSPARKDTLLRQVRRADDRWWRQQAGAALAADSGDAFLLRWVPDPSGWAAALRRAFQECVAATVLIRVAIAAEEQPVVDAVLGFHDQLAFAATLHVADLEDRVERLHRAPAPAGVAAERAWRLAGAVVLATDPGASLPDTPARLAVDLRHACELALAVLHSTADLMNALRDVPVTPSDPSATSEWRRLAGFGRDPHEWFDAIDGNALLGTRLEGRGDPAEAERIEDGLWFADLADAVASWFGHEQARVSVGGWTSAEVDFDEPDPDPGVPSPESVPLAVAGAAQLAAMSARAGPRPGDWSALVTDLVADAERLGLDQKLTLPADVATWDGRDLPGSSLRIEVARTAKQLTEWGNYMGNCIAGYAADANRRFALVALRDASGTIVANVSVQRRGARWGVDQALGRFNDHLADDLEQAITRWTHDLRTPSESGRGTPRPTAPFLPPPPARRRHHRRGAGGDTVLRAAAELADVIGDPETHPHLQRLREALRPIAAELGWRGGDADRMGPFVAVARHRRPGPVADAAGHALDAGLPLAELWEATTWRPLGEALDRLPDDGPDLRRLTDDAVPPLLRLALRDARVSGARSVDLAACRTRIGLFALLAAGDTRLDRAATGRPHTGFVATAVLVLTASNALGGERFASIPVAGDGTLPGRPRPTLTAALQAAQELGVAPARLDEVLADAPGRHLLVPAAWVEPEGWPAFWGRAHRVTRNVRRPVPAGATIAS